jgi:hypothetical protein
MAEKGREGGGKTVMTVAERQQGKTRVKKHAQVPLRSLRT